MEALKEELAFFLEKKAELLVRCPGQFALIKGRSLIGTYPTREQAYAEGVARFGRASFLIQPIVEQGPPEQIPLLAYSLRAGL